MTPHHHPSDDTLMAYAAGTLSAGPRLVLSVHLSTCGHCRDAVRAFEAVGGALLDTAPPAAMADDALERLLARIDAEAGLAQVVPLPSARPRPPTTPDGISLPAALARHSISPWRKLPDLQWARVTLADAPDANVILLRIPAGKPAPRHSHTGREFTQVIHGAFSDGRDHYGLGDLTEADQHVDHQPLVDAEGECICLAAVEGRLRIHGVGRLLQPFIGL
jgi:putative transcriptional regulator